MKQLAMKFRNWGGNRKGAGRKPKGSRAGAPHVPRKQPRRTPAHVTMRVAGGRPSLRGAGSFRALKEAFRGGKERFGIRVTHFSVQGNHLHIPRRALILIPRTSSRPMPEQSSRG